MNGQELPWTDSIVQPEGGMLVQLMPVPGAAVKLAQIGVVSTSMRKSFRKSDLTRAGHDCARARTDRLTLTYLCSLGIGSTMVTPFCTPLEQL